MEDGRKAERERILGRIRALLAKTVENGCTEEEAVSAAEMVSRLLDKYDIDASDLERPPPSDYGSGTTSASDDVGRRLWRPAAAVEKLTGTKSWRQDGDVAFFGRASDVEIALYLLRICERAMRDASAAFDRTTVLFRQSIRTARRSAFLDGMADTLTKKLEAIHAARRSESAGRELVVAKDAMVQDEMDRRGIALVYKNMRRSRDFDPSYGKGEAAGNAVAFNDGVRGPEGRRSLVGEDVGR